MSLQAVSLSNYAIITQQAICKSYTFMAFIDMQTTAGYSYSGTENNLCKKSQVISKAIQFAEMKVSDKVYNDSG